MDISTLNYLKLCIVFKLRTTTHRDMLGIVMNYMANNCDFTMSNFHSQLAIALSQIQHNTCRKLISKVAKQEVKYWIEDSHLYEFNGIEEINNEN